MNTCKSHKKYKAILKPRVDCNDCWLMYYYKQITELCKKQGYTKLNVSVWKDGMNTLEVAREVYEALSHFAGDKNIKPNNTERL